MNKLWYKKQAKLWNEALKRARLDLRDTVGIQNVRDRAEHLDLVAALVRLDGKLQNAVERTLRERSDALPADALAEDGRLRSEEGLLIHSPLRSWSRRSIRSPRRPLQADRG